MLKPIKNTNVFSGIGASNHSEEERAEHDFYATSPKATELLLNEERFSHFIWEPACGAGHISKVLKAHGYQVLSTDLYDHGYGDHIGVDFLATKNSTFSGDIITNPPYLCAAEFVEHAIDLVHPGRKVAMFLKIQFLEGKKRGGLFSRYPPKTIYVSRSRLKCARNGDFKSDTKNSAVAYAWFVWEKGYKGDPVVKWFN